MVYGNQQAEEIKTIKPRQFNLNLSDADYRRIAEKAACAELSVEGLLESFIGDLVSGTYSNGSDECIFRKNRALAPRERSAVPLGTDHCPAC